MKFKIAVELPTAQKLTAGLTPREVHPALVRAEQNAAEAERELEARRRELADHEKIVAGMPARVQRGEVKASALADALRERDARALLVEPAEAALAKARERVAAEEKLATAAVQREYIRRVESIEAVAAELAPVLAELRELSQVLADAKGGGILGSVEWECSPSCSARMQAVAWSQR